METRKVTVDGTEMTVATEESFRQRLKERFPDGIVVPVSNMDMDAVKTVLHYPGERRLGGLLEGPEHRNSQTWGGMNVEVRLQPEDYGLLWPDTDSYFKDELSEAGLDAEENEMTSYLHEHPDLAGGLVEAHLENEEKLRDCLFVEGVSMARVTQIIQQRPELTESNLKNALQLFLIKEEGVRVYEKKLEFEGSAGNVMADVIEDIRSRYTGIKPVERHPYYRTDIRHKLDKALKEAATLKLQQLAFLQTRAASYDVYWSNRRGDNWECTEMTRTFNEMFKGWREKMVDAVAHGNRMRLNVYTVVPEYQKRIFDAVKCSWAFEEMVEVRERNEIPKEILESQDLERKYKNRDLRNAYVHPQGVYFFEKGTPGFVWVSDDRKVSVFGDSLTPEHRQQILDIVREGNVLHEGSSVCLKPMGPEKIFMHKDTGYIQRVRQEKVNGMPVFVHPYNRSLFGNDEGMGPYCDVTGRMTDAKVIGKENTLAVRCKIDGVQQSAAKLSYGDARAFINGRYSEEFLAYKYFASDLLEENRDIRQEHTGGRKL